VFSATDTSTPYLTYEFYIFSISVGVASVKYDGYCQLFSEYWPVQGIRESWIENKLSYNKVYGRHKI